MLFTGCQPCMAETAEASHEPHFPLWVLQEWLDLGCDVRLWFKLSRSDTFGYERVSL